MAGLAKTNDAGDETVTQWLWVNSNHKDKLLKELTDDDLIQKPHPYSDVKTLLYFKITTSRENIRKVKDKIKDFNISLQDESLGPVQKLKHEARLEDCNPMEVVSANPTDCTRKHSDPNFLMLTYLQQQCTLLWTALMGVSLMS